MTITKIARKKLFVDKSRIWNLEEPNIKDPYYSDIGGIMYMLNLY